MGVAVMGGEAGGVWSIFVGIFVELRPCFCVRASSGWVEISDVLFCM